MKNNKKITRMPRAPRVNIGLILLVFVFIYLAFHLFSFFSGKHIAVTEVKQGQIVSDNRYRALVIRKERLVKAKSSGEAYFYLPQASRVKKGETVLSLDKTGDLISEIRKTGRSDGSISDSETERLAEMLRSFNDAYSDDTFASTYYLKQNASSYLTLLNGEKIQKSLKGDIRNKISNGLLSNVSAPSSGLVCLSFDNLNGVTEDSFKSTDFDESSLRTTEVSTGDSVSSGDSVFRLVTDDNWKLITPISDSLADELKDRSTIEIRFDKDSTNVWASAHIITKSGEKYLVLELDDSMDRFSDSRFLDIELLLDDASGLKVPNSSLLTRVLYLIPENCIVKDTSTSKSGVNVRLKDGSTEFRRFLITQTDDNGLWAAFSGASNSNSIVSSDGTSVTALKDCEVKKAYGVYLANKGYTQFVQVRLLYKNGQYSIIEPVNDSSLRLYDHIVLNASGVKNGEILNDR